MTLRTPATIVSLETWEYEYASMVGMRRFTYNWNVKDASHYDRERMEDDRTAQVAATVCELAVAKYTNRYWHGHSWHPADHHKYRDLPDVGRNIEVRRIRSGTRIAVRKSQVGHGLVLWGAYAIPAEFRDVELLGWMKYDDAWDQAVEVSHLPNTTRLIELEKLTL